MSDKLGDVLILALNLIVVIVLMSLFYGLMAGLIKLMEVIGS